MNDNPMRDVIEMMKNKAQREGRQQTSPHTMEALNQRRLREKLDMARNANAMTIQALTDADLWTDKPTGDRVIALSQQAQAIQKEIEALIKEVQGKQA